MIYYPPAQAKRLSGGGGPPMQNPCAVLTSQKDKDAQFQPQTTKKQQAERGVSTTISPDSPQHGNVEVRTREQRPHDRERGEKDRSRPPILVAGETSPQGIEEVKGNRGKENRAGKSSSAGKGALAAGSEQNQSMCVPKSQHPGRQKLGVGEMCPVRPASKEQKDANGTVGRMRKER